MRRVYRAHRGGHVLAVLVASVLLMGCGKNPEVDALKSDAAAQKQQLGALRADADEQKQQLATLRTEANQRTQRIAELSAKLATLENMVADLKPKPRKDSASSGPEQPTANQIDALRKVIAQCVQTVRALAPPGASPINDVHISFDAYYNPAMGRVVNNNHYVSQDAVYAFDKCMTEQGWPLR